MRHARWILAALLASMVAANAADLVPLRLTTVINVPRIPAPSIDGALGEGEYASAQPLNLWGGRGTAAMLQTEGLLGRDDTYLYVAARCRDDRMGELVSGNDALWQNDCIELFVDAEKKMLFFSHMIGDCAAAFSGDVWIPDEWGEPTRGGDVDAKVKAGREADAWVIEMALPLAAFGVEIREDSVWSMGVCREKKTEPVENSSFLGWFNRPGTWPDLTFDRRRVVVDGVGLRNISEKKVKLDLVFKAAAPVEDGDPAWKQSTTGITLSPGETVPVDWATLMSKLDVAAGEDALFAYEAIDGGYTVGEQYRLVQRKQPPKPVDPNVVPEADFEESVLDDPTFWPVAVWGQPAGVAERFKAAGVNIFVAGVDLYPVPRDYDYMDAVWKHGMHAMLPARGHGKWGYYFNPGIPVVTEGQIVAEADLFKRLGEPAPDDAIARALLGLMEETDFLPAALDYMSKRKGQVNRVHTRALAEQLASVVEWKNLVKDDAFAAAADAARTRTADLDSLPKNWRNRRVLEQALDGALATIPMLITDHPAFLGWLFGDEPDNASPAGGPIHTPEEIFADFVKLRSFDNRHPIFLNLGCGVAHERFVGRGATDEMYPRYAQACDILCYDVYPCNSIQPNGPDRLHLQGKGVKRLRQWAGPDRDVWTWLEVNHFSKSGGREPTHDEIKTQHWMALVHGASGHGYFCHSWSKTFLKERMGQNRSFSVSAVADDTIAALGAINAEIRALAPVLNSPTLDMGTATMTRGRRVDYMLKQKDGARYLFAVNMYREPATAEFSIDGVGNATAEVLFEDRTVDVREGTLTQTFAPYAVHRYRIGK